MKEKQLLRDASIEPTSTVIAEGLGFANDAYVIFLEKLKEHDIELTWRYYNDGKAWLGKGLYQWTTRRETQKETTAFWLSIWQGFFRVTIYVPEKYRFEALSIPLGDDMKEMIQAAKQMGKLKFFPLVFDLDSKKDFDELFAMINFRKVLK